MTGETIGIIGGGITGASVAYHLADATERDVVVLEQDSLVSKTTSKSAAYVGFRGGHTAVQRELMRYSMVQYNEFLSNLTTNALHRTLGGLDLATTAQGQETLRSQYQQSLTDQESTGRFVQYFDGSELERSMLLPEIALEEVTAALFWPNYGYVRPSELAFEFVNRAREAGAEFRVNTEVTDILIENGVSGLHTTNGKLEVGQLVLAAGPWNRELAGLAGVKLPIRFSLAPGLLLSDPTTNTYPSLSHVESGIYLRQHHNNRVFVGHYQGDYEEAVTERPSITEKVPAEILEKVINTTETLVTYLYDAGIEEQWLGLRSLTPDSNPIIGGTAVEGLSIVSYNATGIQHAPAAGRILRQQIIDDTPTEFYDEISISRFDGYTDVNTTNYD